MSTITLEQIKADADALAAKIAIFEAQAATTPAFFLPEITIELRPGEHYAGLIVGHDGEPSHHLVLLPGEAESLSWEDAKAWAIGQCGELPTRREQSLLFKNLKEQFEEAWYWSGQEHESDSGYAWCQDFSDGYQDLGRDTNEFRARAVRMVKI